MCPYTPVQVPDLDAIFHFPDNPEHTVPPEGQPPETPPVFVTCSNAGFLDIAFPDWSWWGTAVRSHPAGAGRCPVAATLLSLPPQTLHTSLRNPSYGRC